MRTWRDEQKEWLIRNQSAPPPDTEQATEWDRFGRPTKFTDFGYSNDLQPFYDALRERINASEQSAAEAAQKPLTQNATTFAPNVGGSPLNYEDPYLRGGESQHPGTGLESVMPYQAQGRGQTGNFYQRNQNESANTPFVTWQDQEPQGLQTIPHSMMQPADWYMRGVYNRINQTKRDEWDNMLKYLGWLTNSIKKAP